MTRKSQAKATKGKAGMAGAGDGLPVRRSTAGTGLRVGEASADLPATSEHMDVTAGETAPIQILHERTTQIGPVAVTFRFGRIK